MKPNFSSMTFNCLTNPSPIVSLALKEPIVTWWTFQSTNRKFMTNAKISYYPLLIHKSNVIVLVNVGSRWGYRCKSNYEQSWLEGYFFNNVLWEGKTNLPNQASKPTYASIHSHECLKGKTLSHEQHQVFQKNITWTSSRFL